MPGAKKASRIALDKSDSPWIVADGRVFKGDEETKSWRLQKGIKNATDVGAGAEGSVFAAQEYGSIMKLGDGEWHSLGGSGVSIAVGKGGRPFTVDMSHSIHWPVDICTPEKVFEYWVSTGRKTFDEAQDICKRWGGNLASIRQRREATRIMSIMRINNVEEKDGVWVGGKTVSRTTWKWIDGTSNSHWGMQQESSDL
jgi:hypothetical protein